MRDRFLRNSGKCALRTRPWFGKFLPKIMIIALSSAQGVLHLLHESSTDLQLFALEKINTMVDLHWAEIADELPTIELLFENSKFTNRKLAALVASKVYYHLGEFDDSLDFALKAQELFDLGEKSEFVDTIIGCSL
jgi:26S proteasome regulatory subunit N2